MTMLICGVCGKTKREPQPDLVVHICCNKEMNEIVRCGGEL